MKNAGNLDNLLSKNSEGLQKIHRVQNIIADGNELVNLVMGKQDTNFLERKPQEQAKKEAVFNPQNIIQETVSEESGSSLKTETSFEDDSEEHVNEDQQSNRTQPLFLKEKEVNLESGMAEINYKTSTAGIGKK